MTNPFSLVASSNESTVVAEYKVEVQNRKDYQSEDELEKEFIKTLETQGYEYLVINSTNDLISNLRTQIEKLNNINFSDADWKKFLLENITNPNYGVKEKTRLLQECSAIEFTTEDGVLHNIKLIDKDNVHNNYLQVINQFEQNNGAHKNRYDVTILVNGLPLVHTELKRRGVDISNAFNQIDRYQRESFWSDSGLFEFIQIFVISNGTLTKYYSNTTRDSHINGDSKKKTRGSNSFKFTSYWTDAKNKRIPDLIDFTKTFFCKHVILNILTKYCVFDTQEKLMVMRPYQIVATEKIINKIKIATEYKMYGTIDAGGYIWHTTGSGKTLTSFKTAQLATHLSGVDKVMFVVDRKDLDYQTINEYNRYQKGCVDSNKNTNKLKEQLENPNSRIIVTTIQKLDVFIRKNPAHDVYGKNVVIIFDECHRSQFGKMHTDITKHFKKYYLFGFTGTPIFPRNSSSNNKANFKTTEQVFGDKLHTYTIVSAIEDENVLPFRIDYVNTIKEKSDIKDQKIQDIDKTKALEDINRVKNIVSYVLDNFDIKTKRNKTYTFKDKRVNGFNSIFAADSILMAMKYYKEFKQQIKDENLDFKIALIYSFNPNEEDPDNLYDAVDNPVIDETAKDFLAEAINDYNIEWRTNFSIDGDGFQNYYKDVSQKLKEKELDMLIVVNMFLTGFDAVTLNTLWVDKNLKEHGLIQAFSRTNRILNSVKTFGNIVCFRNLEKETEDAISLFGDSNAKSIVVLKSFDAYYNGYYDDNKKWHIGWKDLIIELSEKYPLRPERFEVIGENQKHNFIAFWGSVLRLKNILSCFGEFVGKEIISDYDFADYNSIYLDLYREYKEQTQAEKEIINKDVIFEIELIKQVDVNVDYILKLVKQYHDKNSKNKDILVTIVKTIDSSLQLKSKKELILDFIDGINSSSEVEKDWGKFVAEEKEKELNVLIFEEKLKEKETKQFVLDAFNDGIFKTDGSNFDKILPPTSMFGNKRKIMRERVAAKFEKFFEKYSNI